MKEGAGVGVTCRGSDGGRRRRLRGAVGEKTQENFRFPSEKQPNTSQAQGHAPWMDWTNQRRAPPELSSPEVPFGEGGAANS